MPGKRYYYLVSYHFEGGHGNIHYNTNIPLDNSFDEVIAAQEYIAEKSNLKSVVISNWIQLKGPASADKGV